MKYDFKEYVLTALIFAITSVPLLVAVFAHPLSAHAAAAKAHAKPKAVAASVVADLSWLAPTTNVDGTPITNPITYNVYQGAMNAVSKVQSNVTGNTAVISTGLTPGTTQCFAVSATELGLEGSESAETCKVIPTPTPTAETPSPPSRITLTLGTSTASPDKTIVTTAGPAIIDAAGNTWALNAAGQIVVNGVIDTTSASVTELAYVSGLVWQRAGTVAAPLWWSKTSPSAQWLPQTGTSVAPL